MVVINLGTNAADIKSLKSDAINMIREVHKAGGICFWVTPPHAQGFPLKLIQNQTQTIFEGIEEAGPGPPQGENCRAINSLEMTHYPYTHRAQGIDGVHYCWDKQLIELGNQWANEAFGKIAFQASYGTISS